MDYELKLKKQIFNIAENTRKRVNKTVFKDHYFRLILDTNRNKLNIEMDRKWCFSTIPYDKGRRYIQEAAINYCRDQEGVKDYIKKHKNDLLTYYKFAQIQNGKKILNSEIQINNEYQKIFLNPLFEIQIAGRLMQHDETGPISSNLAKKFIFSENKTTGISEFLYNYINFLNKLNKEGIISILNSNESFLNDFDNNNDLIINKNTFNAPSLNYSYHEPFKREQLIFNRKNYQPQSLEGYLSLTRYFSNVLKTNNLNRINVVSDIHASGKTLPFTNNNFNILAGDIIDSSEVFDSRIKGISVIGNHELLAEVPAKFRNKIGDDSPFYNYKNKKFFKKILDYNNSHKNQGNIWNDLPIGDSKFYDVIAKRMRIQFPNLIILNNSSLNYNGIQYLGITIPVRMIKRKKKLQEFILSVLKNNLTDKSIPVVIISHAPLFNELSLLKPSSSSYNRNYNCENNQIVEMFKKFNIIGVIHGHHHIPASKGYSKKVRFAGKDLFVIDSKYSNVNTGIELMKYLSGYEPSNLQLKP
ncbi:metallophosphoesterase [Fructilactobacillus sp. Tb1]|uniref:metallophosphoesterase n=1 Tax=Fructilactobacillus sp. Tb1 TaxID=3422304 RepID=UPI003D2E168D